MTPDSERPGDAIRESNVVNREAINVKPLMIESRFRHHDPFEYEYEYRDAEYEYEPTAET